MQTFTMKIHLYFLTFNCSKRNVLLIPLNTKVTNEIKKKNTLDNFLQFLYNAIIYIYIRWDYLYRSVLYRKYKNFFHKANATPSTLLGTCMAHYDTAIGKSINSYYWMGNMYKKETPHNPLKLSDTTLKCLQITLFFYDTNGPSLVHKISRKKVIVKCSAPTLFSRNLGDVQPFAHIKGTSCIIYIYII